MDERDHISTLNDKGHVWLFFSVEKDSGLLKCNRRIYTVFSAFHMWITPSMYIRRPGSKPYISMVLLL